jgi:hypothetical protein
MLARQQSALTLQSVGVPAPLRLGASAQSNLKKQFAEKTHGECGRCRIQSQSESSGAVPFCSYPARPVEQNQQVHG